jgi:predicted alpha/beta superfamily hydrolase
VRKFLVAAVIIVAAAVAAYYLIHPPYKAFKISSKILGEMRVILEYVPNGYKSSGKSYPVLLHLDADPRSSVYGPSFYTIAKNINALGDPVPEMIVLGVTNTNRARDMIPVKETKRDSAFPAPGRARIFLQFITDELIPEVKTRYRTSDFRVLYGRSDSGLFALYALMESPDAFQAVIASSPSLSRCPAFMVNGVKKMFRERPDIARTVFMIYGERERILRNYLRKFSEAIESAASNNFVLHVQRVAGEGHIPKASLQDGLRFVFSKQRGNLDCLDWGL